MTITAADRRVLQAAMEAGGGQQGTRIWSMAALAALAAQRERHEAELSAGIRTDAAAPARAGAGPVLRMLASFLLGAGAAVVLLHPPHRARDGTPVRPALVSPRPAPAAASIRPAPAPALARPVAASPARVPKARPARLRPPPARLRPAVREPAVHAFVPRPVRQRAVETRTAIRPPPPAPRYSETDEPPARPPAAGRAPDDRREVERRSMRLRAVDSLRALRAR